MWGGEGLGSTASRQGLAQLLRHRQASGRAGLAWEGASKVTAVSWEGQPFGGPAWGWEVVDREAHLCASPYMRALPENLRTGAFVLARGLRGKKEGARSCWKDHLFLFNT